MKTKMRLSSRARFGGLPMLTAVVFMFVAADRPRQDKQTLRSIALPKEITTLYSEAFSFEVTDSKAKIHTLNMQKQLSQFKKVDSAFVIEYDDNNFYKPRQLQFQNGVLRFVLNPKTKALVVFNLGPIARNNYLALNEFILYKETVPKLALPKLCTLILCPSDRGVMLGEDIIGSISELTEIDPNQFLFSSYRLGWTGYRSSICGNCFDRPFVVIPCLFVKCGIFPLPRRVFVRRNFNTIPVAEKECYEKAVETMKAWSATDVNNKVGWIFQANIHDYPRSRWPGDPVPPDAPATIDPLFHSCQHGTNQFLSWHRMYLYYFERIVREACGSKTFTLPYWNYKIDPVLPFEFRQPDNSSNDLYNATRAGWVNNGEQFDDLVTDPANALAEVSFSRFSSDLEVTPHGDIHVNISGNMGSTLRAARDPIFWLHHCNIDRIWNKWIESGNGRVNPSSTSWLNQSYSLINERGQAVSMTTSQVLNSVTQLNYRYDDDPITVLPVLFAARKSNIGSFFESFQSKEEILLSIGREIDLTKGFLTALQRSPTTEKLKVLADSVDDLPTDNLIIRLEGLKCSAPVSSSFYVYLNAPDEMKKQERRDYLVGIFNFFGMSPGEMSGHHHDKKNQVEFDLAQIINAQQKKKIFSDEMRITIVAGGRTNVPKEITGNPTVENLVIVLR